MVMTTGSHRKPLQRVRRACDAGIRFMVATGRNFPGAMEELKGTELTCDYVVSSGAEVRNPQQEVVKSTPISIELCEEVYNTAKKYPVSVAFFTDRYDYRIGTKKEIEDGIIQQIRLFNMDIDTSEEIVRKVPAVPQDRRKHERDFRYPFPGEQRCAGI